MASSCAGAGGDGVLRRGGPVAALADHGGLTAAIAARPPARDRNERAPRGDAGAARPSFDRRGSAGHAPFDTVRPRFPLYTESARLEAVLAQLPDTTVGNVAMLAVSADLQDQVAHIDLALSQPALQESARVALWQQRVDTLRQLTGVEATQRWQVALNDTSADTAIY